jgi:hypothetical protein
MAPGLSHFLGPWVLVLIQAENVFGFALELNFQRKQVDGTRTYMRSPTLGAEMERGGPGDCRLPVQFCITCIKNCGLNYSSWGGGVVHFPWCCQRLSAVYDGYDPFKNKTVDFGQRPRPLHNRRGALVRWGMAVAYSRYIYGRFTSEAVTWRLQKQNCHLEPGVN